MPPHMWTLARTAAARALLEARPHLRHPGPGRPPGRPSTVAAAAAAAGLRSAHSAPRPRGLPLEAMPAPAQPWAGDPAHLHEYVDDQHRQLGGVFRDQIGPRGVVFVADPGEMRRVFGLEGKHPLHELPDAWVLYNQLHGCQRGLFFMDGEDWLRMRRLMNRIMLKPEQADIFSAPCQRIANALVSLWQQNNVTRVHDLEGQLYKWSLDTVIAIMMGSSYSAHADKWDNVVKHLSLNVHKIFLESGRMSHISAQHARELNLPVWKRFEDSVNVSLSTARSLVLHMISVHSPSSDGMLSEMLQAGMPEEDIIKVIVDLIIAAGDTTALSLQWTLYLLAKNAEAQEKVAAEVCSRSDVMQSALLRGVVREALRLYPVAPFLTRKMPESCVVGGYELPPMELVVLSIYTSGRDTNNFPIPEKFWPERWLRKSDPIKESSSGSYKAVVNPHASMPFAMGARSCIGRKVAETQMITTLACILQQFKIELLNSGNIEMNLRLVGVPSEPIQLHLTPRNFQQT